MKLYRVTYYEDVNGSQGFEWFLSKSKAKKVQNALIAAEIDRLQNTTS